MVSGGRPCTAFNERGEPCGAPAVQSGEHCFWHDPASAKEALEAARLGGLRRRREKTVAGAYEFAGLGSISEIRRLLEVAVLDSFSLENSIARNRTLAYLAVVAVKLLESGELEARLAALEDVVQRQPSPGASVFALEAAVEGELLFEEERDEESD